MEMSIRDLVLVKHDIGHSLSALRNYIVRHGLNTLSGQLETVESDFRLMCDYMMKGYKDPQFCAVYDALLRRVFRLYGNVRMESVARKRHTFVAARKMSIDIEANHTEIRNTLEGFVQEAAFGTLVNDSQSASPDDVYSRHQRYMDSLFCSVLVSEQWSEATAGFMCRLMLSPTVDQNDALVLISAVTLSVMTVFDVEKWMTLLSVYEKSAVEPLRQRALVGWVLSLPADRMQLFPEVGEGIARVMAERQKREELLQLQLQLFFCANAETDNERIKNEIMPTLMRNSNLRAFGSGFIEKDDDMMRDEIGSEDSDAQIEKMEKTMRRMMDMQKTGIDIYYGGFSQMKRFRFFSQLSNWFAPFSPDHPDLRAVATRIGNTSFLDSLMKNGPFCDSDKYSFAFAIASVIDKLPDNIKGMLANGETLGATMPTEQKESAAYLRRTYMQDLFRFFKLYQNREDFDSPFVFRDDILVSFFFAKPLLSGAEMTEERASLLKFLYRQKHYQHILRLLKSIGSSAFGAEEKRIVALAYLKSGLCNDAITLFESLPDALADPVCLKGMAKACFALHDYERAEYFYSRLVEAAPDSFHNLLGLAVSHLNCGNTEKAMQILFKLNYENPDNLDVKRSLAWGYLLGRRADDAMAIYGKLLEHPDAADNDILSAGYASWFLMRTEEAVRLFGRYMDAVRDKMPEHRLSADFCEDRMLLQTNGVTEYECNVMEYLVENINAV